MQVTLVTFPQTRVAAITHVGSPATEHDTARRLIAWKIEHRLLDPVKNRSYGLHYLDPNAPDPSGYRVDFCLSFEGKLPASGERMSGQPLIFHYVNTGPNVQPHEAITDVYMPLP